MNWIHFFSWAIIVGLMGAARAQPAPTPPQQPPAAAPQPAPPAPAGTTTSTAPTTPAPLPPLSADWQSGFCAGWNTASQVELQRYGNWKALATLGQPAPDSPASIAVNSVPFYVLVQPLPGGSQLSLTDGRSVTCPATPAEPKK